MDNAVVDDDGDAAEETAAYFVWVWADAVFRQAARAREAHDRAFTDLRNSERLEDWSLDDRQVDGGFCALWAEEHSLVWTAYQLERWRRRLALERGEPAPAENKNLARVRNALEHLDEARLTWRDATSSGTKGATGRSLRELRGGILLLTQGDGPLFGHLDLDRIERDARSVLNAIQDELDRFDPDDWTDN